MTETYAGGGQRQMTAGGVILVVASFLSAVLVIAGLAYATGTGARHKAALAAAQCEPNLSPSGLQCTTVQMLTVRYLKIASPVVQQLNADVAAYTASEGHDLAAARAALLAEVTSADALGTSLARFPFPPAVAPVARALILAIRARVKVMAEQARASSLSQLRSFNGRATAASAAVRTQLALIRKALAIRPTASQEP